MTAMEPFAAARAALSGAWRERSARERRAVVLAALVLGAWLVWLLALAPAIRTVRQAPATLAQLDVDLQTMQRLADEAKALRAAPPIPPAQAQAALGAAAARLGDQARLALQGERAVLTLHGLAADRLVAWLGEARLAARVRVVEAQLERTPAGTYNGSVVLALGAGR